MAEIQGQSRATSDVTFEGGVVDRAGIAALNGTDKPVQATTGGTTSTLLLLGVGAAALYFLTRKAR